MKKFLFIVFVLSNISLFSQQGFTTYTYNLTSTINNFKNVSAIELGSGADVWIGLNSNTTNKTLLKFNGNVWTDFTSLVNFPIQTLKYDGSGNLWIGSSTGGLLKFDGATYVQYTTSNSGILSNNVLSIDFVGSLTYIGTNAGISVFDGVSFVSFSRANSGLSSDTIYAFEKDAANNIWIGTAKGLNMMNTSNVILDIGFNDKVYDVMIDAFGDKWLGTNANGLIRYNGSTFTNSLQISGNIIGAIMPTQIFSIAKSPSGNPMVVAKNATTYYQEGFIEVIPSGGQKLMLNKLVSTHNYNKIFAATSNGTIYYASKTTNSSPYTRSILHKFNYNQFDATKDFVNVTQDKIQYLDINNVKAACNPRSFIHGDGFSSMYEVPKGSGKHVNSKSSFWIGGYDTLGQLHVAAELNNANGTDFQPGPLSYTEPVVDTTTMAYYNKVWKVDRLMIENFKLQFQLGNVQNGSYTIPNEILTWPGNPEDSWRIEGYLAPYFDYNNDGWYTPEYGDYPEFRNADQILFWVVNDKKQHLSSSSVDYLGVQVATTAYAYYCPSINDSDGVLNNTTFYNYRMINKHDTVGGNVFYYGKGVRYDSTMIGFVLEPNLGNSGDNYVGCDVQNNFAFMYNGDNYDDDVNGIIGYHGNTPYYSINILRGPYAPMGDGIDNDKDGCVDCTWKIDPVTHQPNTSLPPDDEFTKPEYNRMNGFVNFYNNPNPTTGIPSSNGNGIEYFRYMNNKWKNGSPLVYDGISGTNSFGPPCAYLYPGSSDPIGYGVGGTPQSPLSMPSWSEVTAGNLPGERRMVINSGKFALIPSEIIELDVAMIFTQDSAALVNGSLYEKVVLDNNKIYDWWKFNTITGCIDLTGVGLKEYKGNIKVNLFPNPATTQLTIDAGYENEIKEIKVLDILGKEISKQSISSKNKTQINIENYNSGVYLIQVKCANGEFFGKFIKH